MKDQKVAIALSGGVDSGVAAALLVKEGYDVTGFHLKLWSEDVKHLLPGEEKAIIAKLENKCCTEEGQEAAEKTAKKLGIPFELVNLSYQFKKGVVDYFLDAYASGLTPNPCVMCNKLIKFGQLYDYVLEKGFDFLATGHYARLTAQTQKSKLKNQNYNSKVKIFRLLRAVDQTKDQTYFLYNLKQNQLRHILFPIGELKKTEVRKIARELNLPVAERPESQEICFLPETDYRPFLKRHLKSKIKPGEVVSQKGEVIGEHQGLPLYTIGQRHGFEISNLKSRAAGKASGDARQISNLIPPFYVIAKDMKRNRLIVGFGKETEKDEFEVEKVNWIEKPIREVLVRLRHQGELLPAQVKISGQKVKVTLVQPQRGVAPGQAAVFYKGEEVLGGGIIN